MSISVVNLRHGRPAHTVYVGRTCARVPGSALGNPYHRQPGEAHGATLARYRQWLRAHYRAGGVVRQELERLADLAAAGDLVLGCWCKPHPCHGDVIKEALEGILAHRGTP